MLIKQILQPVTIVESSEMTLSSTARQIGLQLYNEARNKAYQIGHRNKANEIASAMANRFYSNILAAIDEESRFQSAKNIK